MPAPAKKCRSWPVLILGTRDLNQKIAGFASGCDDYLAEPYEVTELQLRVEALMRRAYRYASRPLTSYELNGTHIDFVRRLVVRGAEQTNLRKRECAVLRYLIERKGRVVTRDELLQNVWGYSSLLQTRVVDTHIRLLRKTPAQNREARSSSKQSMARGTALNTEYGFEKGLRIHLLSRAPTLGSAAALL